MDKNLEEIKKRMEDLLRRSYTNNTFVFTRFLSPTDAACVYDIAYDCEVKLWGGAEGCERVMVRFGDVSRLGYEIDFPISVLKISPLNPKFAQSLTHRDYLGAFMSQGVERDTIGDIIVKEKTGYIFVCDSIGDYICDHIDTIGHTTVICTKCDKADKVISVPEPAFDDCMLIVPSPRIDAIISRLYNLSRSEARNLFTAGLVLQNGRSCGNESLIPKEADVFAVRGYGKFIYDATGDKTKKGNVVVKVRRYV